MSAPIALVLFAPALAALAALAVRRDLHFVVLIGGAITLLHIAWSIALFV